MDRKSWGPPSWIGSRGGRHLGSDVVGAAILDRKSWGPPSWIGSDVKNAKVGPILLIEIRRSVTNDFHKHFCNVIVHAITTIICDLNAIECDIIRRILTKLTASLFRSI